MLTDTEFYEGRQRLITAWRAGDVVEAQAVIDLVLAEGSPAMKAECLFYDGMFAEERGALAEARASWSNALQYARNGSFLRFQIETSLGGLSERETQSAAALNWFRSALETCCSGDEFAGTKALAGYLRVNQEEVEAADEAAVACVAEKSWRVMELPGAPDANDWKATVAKLREEVERRASAITDESL